jgi:hypothetical protein
MNDLTLLIVRACFAENAGVTGRMQCPTAVAHEFSNKTPGRESRYEVLAFRMQTFFWLPKLADVRIVLARLPQAAARRRMTAIPQS